MRRKGSFAALIAIAILAAPEPSTSGQPDPLEALLRSNNRRCADWRTVSRLTQDRLRKANATGTPIDGKLLEASFGFMDFCAGELELRIVRFSSTGLTERDEAARRAARAYAALVVVSREALGSQTPAESLDSWNYLNTAVPHALDFLRAIVDGRFGKGALSSYLQIKRKPAAARTDAERKTYAEIHTWVEPL